MGSYYISEKQASLLLSRLAGLNINIDDMDIYSNAGIVPAYIKFKPKDKSRYPGNSFQFVQPSTVSEVGLSNLTAVDAQGSMQILPFPIPDCGTINSSVGITFAVFVADSDRRLVEVSDFHYERVYAPQEITLAAKNILRASSTISIPAITHTCGETWEIERDQDHDAPTAYILSPFATNDSAQVEKRHRSAASEEGPSGMKMIISGMIELIEELSSKQGKKYTRTNIQEWLQSRFPELPYRGMGVGEDSIKKYFGAASKERKLNDEIARQRNIELARGQEGRLKIHTRK